MRNILYGIIILLTFTSCRDENAVDRSKSSNYYLSEDGSRILYDVKEKGMINSLFSKGDYKEVTEDVKHFSVISDFFAKDSKQVYFKYSPVKNVDYNSFAWDRKLNLPKDKKRLYFPKFTEKTDQLEVIKDADPATYERVELPVRCLLWYRDKNHYFYDHKKTDADRKTLSFESPFFPFDNAFLFPVENGVVKQINYQGRVKVLGDQLIRDDHAYYFHAGCDSLYRIIRYNDPQKFEYYDVHKHIFRVDNFIYIYGILFLANVVDADSFEVLEYAYMKDKKRVYYKNSVLPDADPETFVVLSDKYAKDKNHVYEKEKVLTGYKPEEFKEDSWGRFPTEMNYGKAPRERSHSWDDDD